MILWTVFVLLVVAFSSSHHCVVGEPEVPCFFIFGDSLSDNGNNNLLPTVAKCIYPPYGIDFPSGPTGRFTNGRTFVDILADLLGFEDYIPPVTFTRNRDIFRGLNYASGTAGILDESGNAAGFHFSMNVQVGLHRYTVDRLTAMLKDKDKAQKHLNKCLYSIGMGSNDYLNNYFLPDLYPTSEMYTPKEYAAFLGEEYSKQIQTLHDLGARKFILIGMAELGCIPKYVNELKNGSCNEEVNRVASHFDNEILLLVDKFNKKLNDSRFVYVNITAMPLPTETLEPGLSDNAHKSCCETGMGGLCLPFREPCENRSKFFYWDAFHPTEAGNRVFAERAYKDLKPYFLYPDHHINHLAHQP